ncbi:hypothetical protein B0O80DRAFT_216893 [Mortierella sp. GBAus27b]|nr:hypothetical protein B0O80DRAFT_216893 [Mortierella sp. GBAus27b]
MPNVATKPRSADDIPELESTESCTASPAICRLPSVPPAPFTNQKVSFDAFGQPAGSFSPTSSQRPGFDHRRSSQRASSIGHPRTPNTATGKAIMSIEHSFQVPCAQMGR